MFPFKFMTECFSTFFQLNISAKFGFILFSGSQKDNMKH